MDARLGLLNRLIEPSLLVGLILFAFGVNPPPVQASDLSVDSIKILATSVAEAHNLNTNHFLVVIDCESQWDKDSVGDKGTSFGLAQLHNPKSDWGVTPEQAKDPYVSLPIMAKAWEQGQQSRWSCWNKYQKQGWPSDN